MSPASPDAGNFAERLRFWRVSQHLTQLEAARQLDIDRSYLSQVERGRPPGNALRTRFLLLERSKTTGNGAAAQDLRNLPLLSAAQAGQMTRIETMPRDWDEAVPSDVADEHAFAVRLRGDSMESRFSDGDIAVLLPGTTATNGDIVVANLKGQGILCRIMQVQLDKSLLSLSSYNPAYPPTEHRRDEFHWVFPVATVIRPLLRR